MTSKDGKVCVQTEVKTNEKMTNPVSGGFQGTNQSFPGRQRMSHIPRRPMSLKTHVNWLGMNWGERRNIFWDCGKNIRIGEDIVTCNMSGAQRKLKKDYSWIYVLHRFSHKSWHFKKKILARASLILIIISMSYLYYTNKKKREVQVQSSWASIPPTKEIPKYTITCISHLPSGNKH